MNEKYMHNCIHTLTRWMDRIDKAVTPHLPLRVIVEETKKDGEYNYVRKPFKKDGTYTSKVIKFFGDRIPCVVGPFSRIRFRHTDLDSNLETKKDGEHEYVKKPFKKDGNHTSVVFRFMLGSEILSSGSVGGPFSRISFRHTDLDSNLETKDC